MSEKIIQLNEVPPAGEQRGGSAQYTGNKHYALDPLRTADAIISFNNKIGYFLIGMSICINITIF